MQKNRTRTMEELGIKAEDILWDFPRSGTGIAARKVDAETDLKRGAAEKSEVETE